MKKKDLRELAGISPSTIAKLGRNENINTNVLVKICCALKCNICEIIEIIEEKSLEEGTNNINEESLM
jgi:DNA-binding Xre family transcriptional regulator